MKALREEIAVRATLAIFAMLSITGWIDPAVAQLRPDGLLEIDRDNPPPGVTPPEATAEQPTT